MKHVALVSVLLALLVVAPQVSADWLASYRNVSSVSGPDFFAGLAVRWGIFSDGNGVGVEADVLELVMLFNNLYFAGYRGEAYKSKSNYTDFAEAALAFLIRHEAIVEYNETNNIPGFQPGPDGDQILSAYQLWSRFWTVSVTPTPVTFVDGSVGTLYEIDFTTLDGVFNYNVKYAGRPYLINGVNITADRLKFGWELFYYNYTQAVNAPGAQLALVAIVGIEAGVASNYNAPNDSYPFAGLNVFSEGYVGYLNIENTADTWDLQAAYAEAGVAAFYVKNFTTFLPEESVVAGWDVGAIILSYLRPNAFTIIHDPDFGADVPDTPSPPVSSTTSGGVSTSSGSSTASSTTGGSSSTTGSKSSGASSVVASLALFFVGMVAVLLL